MVEFGPFRLDADDETLTRDGQRVRLRPKAFAVLAHLAAAGGRLVTKQELFDAVWPDVFVGDATLKTCMREIRDALGDDARRPAFIETAHRRGYRFAAAVKAVDGAPPPAGPFAPPRTRYARHGDANIAYQVFGEGPLDLVVMTGWISHLDDMWAEPRFAAFLMRLAAFARVIAIDPRGTGLSDSLPRPATPDERTEDLRAVMDAVGAGRAVLAGFSDAASVCAAFARRHSHRVARLVMFGAYARGARSRDYPWGLTREQHETLLDRILHTWGGPFAIDRWAPSLSADHGFRCWWSAYLRRAVSPASAVAIALSNAALDIRETLRAIRVPTLVLHRQGDRIAPFDAARDMARSIAGARFVELAGDDHLPFVGDHEAIAREIERFARVSIEEAAEAALATA